MDAVDLHLELIKLQGQQYLLRLSLHDSAISAPIDLLNGQRLPVTIDPADPRLQQFSLAAYGQALCPTVFGAPAYLVALPTPRPPPQPPPPPASRIPARP